MITQGFLNGLACEGDGLLELDVCGGTADLDKVLARPYVPLALTLIGIIAKLVGIEFQLHALGLSRLQSHTSKALQLDRTQRLVTSRG